MGVGGVRICTWSEPCGPDQVPRSRGYREQSKGWERRSFKGVVRRAVLKNRFTERDAAAEFESLEWLEDGKHPLDWNGPTGRIFTRFRDEDLDQADHRSP